MNNSKFSFGVLILVVIAFAGIAVFICSVQNVDRGTPQLYDYATDEIKQHAMVPAPPGYPMGMYITSQDYKIDGKPLIYSPSEMHYMIPIHTFSNTIMLPNGNLLTVTHGPGNKGHVLSFCNLLGTILRRSKVLDPDREDCQLTLLADGRVLVSGGCTEDGIVLSSIQIFDPHTMNLEEFAKLNVARAEHTARKLNNGNVLVAGGTTTNELSDSGADYTSTLELIDIQNKSATLIGQMRQSRAIPMLEPIGIDKCIIRHGKFLDTNNNPTEAKLPMNLEAWEIYTGKTTKSYRRPYPMQSWLWCLSNTLHKNN